VDCKERPPSIDMSKRCLDSRSPTIHAACSRGFKGELKRLIAQGVDLNIKNRLGNTPLHIAIRDKNEEIVRMLVENGADIFAVNADNESPLDWARALDRESILKGFHNEL